MFHWVTGMPFDSELHGGAYDDLTLWEQIDDGAQYTPAKKWLLSVPIMLYVFQRQLLHDFRSYRDPRFLASTHYTNYNPWLFAVNLTALIVFAIIPKLPQVSAHSLFPSIYSRTIFLIGPPPSCTANAFASCPKTQVSQ